MTGLGDLNLKFLLILAISVLMNSLNFMLSLVGPDKNLITSGPEHQPSACQEKIP